MRSAKPSATQCAASIVVTFPPFPGYNLALENRLKRESNMVNGEIRRNNKIAAEQWEKMYGAQWRQRRAATAQAQNNSQALNVS